MRIRTMHFGPSTTQNFSVDRETSLVGVTADAGFVVSTDPSRLTADFLNAAADFQLDGLLIIQNGTDFLSPFKMDFPLSVGEVIYVSIASTPGNVQLLFDP